MSWLLAVVLKPFFALILFGLICLPARLAVMKHMKPGKLKSLLLYKISETKPTKRPE